MFSEEEMIIKKIKIKIPFMDKIKEIEKQKVYTTTFNYSQYLGKNLNKKFFLNISKSLFLYKYKIFQIIF